MVDTLWGDFPNRANILDDDVFLITDAGGAGWNVPGSAIAKKDVDGAIVIPGLPVVGQYVGVAEPFIRVNNENSLDGIGRENRADFIWQASKVVFTVPLTDAEGGVGGPLHDVQYHDFIQGWTTNMDESGAGRINPAVAGVGWYMESLFRQEDTWASEVQLRFIPQDNLPADPEKRPIGFFLNYGKAVRDKSTMQTQVDRVYFTDWMGVQSAFYNVRTGDFNCVNLRFAFGYNNVPALLQRNVAGTADLALPSINERDELLSERPSYEVYAPALNIFGVSAYRTRLLLAPVAGGYGDYILGGSDVAGNFNASFRQITATGELRETFLNAHATGKAISEIATVGGDCYDVRTVGSNSWSFGVHASTGEMRLTNSGSLTVLPGFRMIPTSFISLFSGTICPGIYTFGTLPLAATAGEGAVAVISDGVAGNVWAGVRGGVWKKGFKAFAPGRTRILRSTVFSVANAVFTDVQWDAGTPNVDDAPGAYVSGTSLININSPAGATEARFSIQAFWASNSAGRRLLQLKKNGAVCAADYKTAQLESCTTMTTGWLPIVGGTDVFKLTVEQSSGAALDFGGVIGVMNASIEIEWR